MAHLLRVPEISAGTTEAVLATWPVAENSPYSATDVIATVETAKAVIDIEAEENGVILRRLVPEGADVAVGQPIALIGALIVGVTAAFQLRRELPLRSLDANVTKLLLGLMIVGCVLAFFAAINVLGAHSA